jgi:hypothetical protein
MSDTLAKYTALIGVKGLSKDEASAFCKKTKGCEGYMHVDPSEWEIRFPLSVYAEDDAKLRELWKKARASKNPADEDRFADEFAASVQRLSDYDKAEEGKNTGTVAEAKARAIKTISEQIRTGKQGARNELGEMIQMLRFQAQGGPGVPDDLSRRAKSLLQEIEEAKRTKQANGAAKRLVEHYFGSLALANISIDTQKGSSISYRENPTAMQTQPSTEASAPLSNEAKRAIQEYDCRGHWWNYTPGFVTLALVGAVAGLVRRAVK